MKLIMIYIHLLIFLLDLEIDILIVKSLQVHKKKDYIKGNDKLFKTLLFAFNLLK